MNFKRRIKRIVIGIGVLLIVQTTTFYLFAHRQLKDKLLVDWMGSLNDSSDSVYVRDFYVSDCYVGDTWTYYSHKLNQHEEFVKERLSVKHIIFEDQKKNRNVYEILFNNDFNLAYCTWVQYQAPWSVYGLFTTKQVEELKVDQYFYTREVDYQWLLFFWWQHSELIRVVPITYPGKTS